MTKTNIKYSCKDLPTFSNGGRLRKAYKKRGVRRNRYAGKRELCKSNYQ